VLALVGLWPLSLVNMPWTAPFYAATACQYHGVLALHYLMHGYVLPQVDRRFNLYPTVVKLARNNAQVLVAEVATQLLQDIDELGGKYGV
jgi:hypothetical protein